MKILGIQKSMTYAVAGCICFFAFLSQACSGENTAEQSVVVESSSDSSRVEDPVEPKIPFVGGPVLFSEVDPVNIGYKDHEGGDAGWVELFNTSSDTINLSGKYLTNSLAEPKKWQLGNVVIPPTSFMLVFLSGKNYPDFVEPSDTTDLISSSCWVWTDSQNDPPGESYANNLPGKKNLCFKEGGTPRFGAVMKLGENEDLGWSSISSYIGALGWDSTDVVDLTNANEILFQAYITKNRKASLHLIQTGLSDWKGFEMVFTGTGDSSTVYRASIPQGTSLPDLANIYGTRLSPESNERGEVTVKAFSYIARNRGHEPHASFKIKNADGTIYLMDDTGILDSVAYREVPPGKSWSYGSQGVDQKMGWGYGTPSPYGFTSEEVIGEKSPAIDDKNLIPPSGFYSVPFDIAFPAEQFVRCTQDGVAPSEISPLTTSLKVASTMAIRCASFIPGQLPGEIMNRTYVFEEQSKLPVVFITVDQNSMFDPDSGIYMEGPDAQASNPHFGANYWQDKEVPAFVEFMEAGMKQPAFAENAGIKIFGNYSRANPKKSVAITFREKYGENRLKYPLFPEFPDLKKFKVFILRNNGSNFGHDYIRDMLTGSISEGLGVDYQRGRASVVYYNGEYYGIHNIRERSTEYYFETHYGFDPEHIDLLKADNSASNGSPVEYQNLMNWLEDHSLSSEENYAYVSSQIDVDNFMNYIHLETFVNNRDWPSNNLKKWRTNNPKTPWKWFVYDTDFGFGNSFSEFSNNIFEFATNDEGDPSGWPNGPNSTLLLRRLLENQKFRSAFVNRMMTLLSTNFSSARTVARINTLMSAIASEIPKDQKRWKLNASRMERELEKMISFAETRPKIITAELREFFDLEEETKVNLSVIGKGDILIHGLPVGQYPVDVNFFKGLKVEISAAPRNGYVWAGWSDGVQEQNRVISPSEITSITAYFK